jgi:hypothetical protein
MSGLELACSSLTVAPVGQQSFHPFKSTPRMLGLSQIAGWSFFFLTHPDDFAIHEETLIKIQPCS